MLNGKKNLTNIISFLEITHEFWGLLEAKLLISNSIHIRLQFIIKRLKNQN